MNEEIENCISQSDIDEEMTPYLAPIEFELQELDVLQIPDCDDQVMEEQQDNNRFIIRDLDESLLEA